MTDFTHFTLRLKGDGSRYKFRVKSSVKERHGYTYGFLTTGEWEVIEIPMTEMEPEFHGEKLNLPDYPGKQAMQITIVAGNGQEEDFYLELDNIAMR